MQLSKDNLVRIIGGVVVLIGVLIWWMWYSAVPYDVSDPAIQQKLTTIENLRENIKKGEDFVSSYIEMGRIYEQLGDDRRALATYKELARLRPKSSPPFIVMGQYYREHEQYTLSEKNLLKAVENDPDNVSIYQDLSLLYIYCIQGRESSFETMILDIVNKYPTIKPNLIHILAFYFRDINNKGKAQVYLKQLFELAPERSQHWQQALDELDSK